MSRFILAESSAGGLAVISKGDSLLPCGLLEEHVDGLRGAYAELPLVFVGHRCFLLVVALYRLASFGIPARAPLLSISALAAYKNALGMSAASAQNTIAEPSGSGLMCIMGRVVRGQEATA